MSKPDGGPAFPRPASEFTKSGTCPDGNDPIGEQDGMSLRDYFAAKALEGCVYVGDSYDAQDVYLDKMARAAYHTADAMLRAREQS